MVQPMPGVDSVGELRCSSLAVSGGTFRMGYWRDRGHPGATGASELLACVVADGR
jgi:hypothetical protein